MMWSASRDILCSRADIAEHEFDASFGTPGHAANPAIASFNALPLVMARHVDRHPKLLQSFHDLLINHHRAECKDPRDKIFGLLGLVTLEERALLERFFPDYNMSEDHVRIIALAHVVQYNVLDGAPDVTTRSDELFMGLGVRSVAERRRLLRRAQISVFDYIGCSNSGEAELVLELSDMDDACLVDEEDEGDGDFEGPREEVRRRRKKKLGIAAEIILVIAWLYFTAQSV
ncbi:hypothetical protein V8F20_011636 [Naviculisporaceae sp. PSN 640]